MSKLLNTELNLLSQSTSITGNERRTQRQESKKPAGHLRMVEHVGSRGEQKGKGTQWHTGQSLNQPVDQPFSWPTEIPEGIYCLLPDPLEPVLRRLVVLPFFD